MTVVRILHLSDLQWDTARRWADDPVLTGLITLIGQWAKAGRTPDLVAVTGDLTAHGRPDEFAALETWLIHHLLPALGPFPRTHLLLVPGNHDVHVDDLSPLDRASTRHLLEADDQAIADAWRHDTDRHALTRRFSPYLHFLGRFYGTEGADLFTSRRLTVRGITVGAALLPSPWTCTGAAGERPRLGRYALHQALTPLADAHLTLALMHHPLDQLRDGRDLRPLLETHCPLLLHGGLHDAHTQRAETLNGLVVVAAGSLTRNDQVTGCHLLEVDTAAGRLRLHPYLYAGDTWIHDRNQCPPDGSACFPLALNIPDAGSDAAPDASPDSPPPPDDDLPPAVLFVGRTAPLAALCDGLLQTDDLQVVYQLQGMGGVGKSTLAREAARRLAPHFDRVLEFLADGLTPERLARDLTARLGLPPCEPRTPDEARRQLSRLTGDRRLLLLLDNVTDPGLLKLALPQTGTSRYLITTRDPDLAAYLRRQRADLHVHSLNLHLFTEEESLALFRAVLGDLYDPRDDAALHAVGTRLGRLPVALSLAANRLVFPPYDTPAELQTRLQGDDRLKALAEGDTTDLRTLEAVYDLAHTGLNAGQEQVLQQLAACAEGPVPRDFLEALLGDDARRGAEDLHRAAWCTAAGRGPERTYELHVLVRDLVRRHTTHPAPRDRFLQLIHDTYTSKEVHFTRKDAWLPQCREAIRLWAHDPDPRQQSLVSAAFHEFCAQRGHGALFLHLADQMAGHFPNEVRLQATCLSHKALTLESFGRLNEAMQLQLQAQKIYEALNDQNGLQGCYGNQALILQAWGRRDDAMALHKKEEAICITLGDQAGLQACYGNQALILKAWGRLDDAMALLQKQEAICITLGDQAGLQVCYGNQALILKAWGRLDDAMVLLQKQEAICITLGDQACLAICWWNMGDLFGQWGRQTEQRTFWKKAMALRLKIGIPTQDMDAHYAALVRAMGGKERGLGKQVLASLRRMFGRKDS